MPRRITVPDEHVAVVLPNQLADDLSALLFDERRDALARWRKFRASDVGRALHSKDYAEKCGEIILMLLEAREA